jgi:hypothetical protein
MSVSQEMEVRYRRSAAGTARIAIGIFIGVTRYLFGFASPRRHGGKDNAPYYLSQRRSSDRAKDKYNKCGYLDKKASRRIVPDATYR